ncbi:Nn.00g067030.m01.CDS01 [Neocucurbitaria sp. VM-36]
MANPDAKGPSNSQGQSDSRPYIPYTVLLAMNGNFPHSMAQQGSSHRSGSSMNVNVSDSDAAASTTQANQEGQQGSNPSQDTNKIENNEARSVQGTG